MKKIFGIFNRKKKTGCPVCYEENTVGFGFDYLDSKYHSTISKSEEIGEVQVYECLKCGSNFFVEGNMFQKFSSGQIEILKEFVRRDLQIDNDFSSELNSIGLTDDWNMSKLAPAKITLIDGKIYDFATIRISKNPPIGYYLDHFSRIIFIDEVNSITKSEYSISQEIREIAKNAEEMRMGFYPTALKTSEGQNVVINGHALFFKNGKIKGSDLKLDNQSWDHKLKYVYEDKIENQILVVAKG